MWFIDVIKKSITIYHDERPSGFRMYCHKLLELLHQFYIPNDDHSALYQEFIQIHKQFCNINNETLCEKMVVLIQAIRDKF